MLACVASLVRSQTATISGIVKGGDGEPIERVTIGIKELPKSNTLSNEKGAYSLQVETDRTLTIIFQDVSYRVTTHTFVAKPGDALIYSPQLQFKNELGEVVVTDIKSRGSEFVSLDPKVFKMIPSPTGNIEDIIKTQMGVSSNNELSSGYSVRGGNFDENLVYVNDIEVYRPFLARSGQQEGLSFANPNMVQSINFSAGGFDAKYGDKMSSVLDITYRKPQKFAGSASASFLGGNVQLEGISKNRLVAWNVGARYRTNTYLLNTLDTKGEYRPSALDVQSFITFDINPKLKVEFLGNIANNRYLEIPTNRQTTFGTVTNALRFTVYFDGQELMDYTTYMAGVSTTYKPNGRTKLKFISSAYRSNEQEIFTVQGQYYIDQLQADLGQPNFGQVAYNRGIGTFLNNGRSYLNAMVFNFEHKGTYTINRDNEFLWGAREQSENIVDHLSQWQTVDSSGYIVPYNRNEIDLMNVYKSNVTLNSWRSQAYVQYNYTGRLRDSSQIKLTGGVRGNYWTVNEQLVVSPRLNFAWKPNWRRDWLFKFSTGLYYQPPFYRELRNFNGTLNTNVKAQQSIHFILTGDYIFKMWNRPFKFTAAAYYKQLNQLDPYEIDDIRIRYFANNDAKGYAVGSDFRINGEFIKGAESWASIGFLRTYEYSPDNIHYVYYNKEHQEIVPGIFDQAKTDSQRVDPGYIPRPTDKLITFSMFFQDYLPRFPRFKLNMNMQFGTGLPFGPPNNLRWEQVLRMPAYRRVDAGIAYNAIKEDREFKRKNVFNNVKEMWLFLEVFNLLQIQNTVSYTWVKDVTGNQYAIPNYLTNRQLNIRVQIRF